MDRPRGSWIAGLPRRPSGRRPPGFPGERHRQTGRPVNALPVVGNDNVDGAEYVQRRCAPVRVGQGDRLMFDSLHFVNRPTLR